MALMGCEAEGKVLEWGDKRRNQNPAFGGAKTTVFKTIKANTAVKKFSLGPVYHML